MSPIPHVIHAQSPVATREPPAASVVPALSAAQHIPALDGVRGVALLLVLALHAVDVVPVRSHVDSFVRSVTDTGYTGVDLFFVLSGFLITGILLDTKDRAGYFRTFYGRRVLRIVPIYVAFLVAALWLLPPLGLISATHTLALHLRQGWYWSYLTNVLVARGGWGGVIYGAGHLWSLSVEEQFYLVWPLCVFAMSRRGVLFTAAGAVVAAEVLRLVAILHGVSGIAVYVLLPTRMDALAAGAMLAVCARWPEAWPTMCRWLSRLALPACLVLAVLFGRLHGLPNDGPLVQLFGFPAVIVIASTIVALAVGPELGHQRRSRWAHPALRFVGRYSYGMYLWHLPIVVFLSARVFPGGRPRLLFGTAAPWQLAFTLLVFAATLAAALASWHLIELPFLRLKRFIPSPVAPVGTRSIPFRG